MKQEIYSCLKISHLIVELMRVSAYRNYFKKKAVRYEGKRTALGLAAKASKQQPPENNRL